VIPAAEIVDWKALGEVVAYSLVAGVGVTLMYSIAIVGATRFADLRRDNRNGGAIVYAVFGLIGLAVSIAAIVAGIILMTTKG
jgi:hypothetical protein